MDDWDDLESVLDDFQQRRAAEQEARRRAEEEETRFRVGCTGILENLAFPTLEAAARSLSRRGHDCQVTRRIADYDIPSVDIVVRPQLPGEDWVRRSRMSFRCVSTEGLVVFWEVCPPRKDPVHHQSTHTLSEARDEWVKRKILEFVRAVLQEY